MKTVYLETSVFGYLTGRRSRDLLASARQQITERWWHDCRHIDNAEKKPAIRAVCAALGYPCPEICTPEELMGGSPDEG